MGSICLCDKVWPGRAQVYSTNLGQVVDIVVSHQAVALKAALVARLMAALVLPAPEHYRPLLRRLAALGAVSFSTADATCSRFWFAVCCCQLSSRVSSEQSPGRSLVQRRVCRQRTALLWSTGAARLTVESARSLLNAAPGQQATAARRWRTARSSCWSTRC